MIWQFLRTKHYKKPVFIICLAFFFVKTSKNKEELNAFALLIQLIYSTLAKTGG
jgi:hypothetical protein